ncbi:ras-related protein Rab-26, partial [Cimex lectularius]|uniref:Ras-related protein Rab-26 n=1 Tax=Cimex lectularius TaxID=79782 RepID=A0A8I6SJU6_CIMLE
MSALSVMATDDSMSDDVFETETESRLLSDPRSGKPTPSPTGYRDYTPDPKLLTPIKREDSDIAHKTILLGDSGVGKTSLLVQFDTGKFQSGTFSATVGIGFTGQPTAWSFQPRSTSEIPLHTRYITPINIF